MSSPDISILGWAPTGDQQAAGFAVLVGVILAVALLALLKRASRVLLVMLISAAIGLWVWLR